MVPGDALMQGGLMKMVLVLSRIEWQLELKAPAATLSLVLDKVQN